MIKKIIHIDMDAFYAAIEQRDFTKKTTEQSNLNP